VTTLVTGAGGFIGGHLVRALAERGEAVRALDLSFPAPLPEHVRRIEASILDPEAFSAAAKGCEAVIHCAAIADLWTPQPILYHRVNMRGTCEALIAARMAGARMVHVSSYTTLIGGPDPGEVTLDETVELTPSDMLGRYPRSKREAELAVLSAARLGQDALMVLPSAPVGPGDHRRTPPTRMIQDLARGKIPALLDCLLNLVDVRALADGIIAARDRGAAGERYLLTGEDITMADLAQRVTERTGTPAPRRRVPYWLALVAAQIEDRIARLTKHRPAAPLTGVRLAGRRVRFDNAKARAALGFDPPPFDDALSAAIAEAQ